MVQTEKKGRVENVRPPAAPLDDEAKIQHLTDELLFRMLEYQHIKIPEEMLLGSLRDGRLRVLSPIRVKFTAEGGQTIAEASELDEFGFGENASEALADLQRAIAELYFTLENEQERLGTDLQRVWDILQKKINKR